MAPDPHSGERIAVLEEKSRSIEASHVQMSHQIAELSEIRADGKMILSKLDDIKANQAAMTIRFDDQDKEIAAITKRQDRMDGALAIIVSLAGAAGGAIGFGLHWLTDFISPHKN